MICAARSGSAHSSISSWSAKVDAALAPECRCGQQNMPRSTRMLSIFPIFRPASDRSAAPHMPHFCHTPTASGVMKVISQDLPQALPYIGGVQNVTRVLWTALRDAASARAAKSLVVEGRIDQVSKQRAVVVALARCLDEQQREQLFCGIHPEGRAGKAAPEVLPDGTRHMRDAGLQPNGETKAETMSGQQQIARSGNGPRDDPPS